MSTRSSLDLSYTQSGPLTGDLLNVGKGRRMEMDKVGGNRRYRTAILAVSPLFSFCVFFGFFPTIFIISFSKNYSLSFQISDFLCPLIICPRDSEGIPKFAKKKLGQFFSWANTCLFFNLK